MGDLSDDGIDLPTLQKMYDEHCRGAKKSDLERRYLNKPESHGKLFTRLVRDYLGIETEHQSHLTKERNELLAEIRRLKALLRANGIEPDKRKEED